MSMAKIGLAKMGMAKMGLTKMSFVNMGLLSRRLAVLTFLISFLALAASCGTVADSIVIVAGSTSVQPYAEVLAEDYALIRPEVEVDVQGGGSSAGITAARSGTADIGMSSRHLKDSESDLWSVEIALDGLAVIIHPSNPINDLPLERIMDIYTGSIVNWRDLGGADANIHVIAREESSGTRSAFEELVMNKKTITPKAIVQDSNGAVRQLVSGDRHAIGFISLGLVDDSVKAIALGGVKATLENVQNLTYKLYRPFLLVCSHEPEGANKEFIDFILSAEGRRILTSEGLITKNGGEK